MGETGRRGVDAALRELLSSGFAGTQEDIADALRKKGVEVNQSTISRAMRRLGAVKSSEGEGTIYRFPSDVSRASYAGSIAELVRRVDHNEMIIIIKTVPGSASFVGEFLDHAKLEDVLGSIAGDDTLFIAPKSASRMRAALDEISKAIGG
jgi:transcriptional regulator of arginine metabolism